MRLMIEQSAVNKWNKQIYLKATEQIRSLKFFMILQVKVKISYIYSNVEYANFNTVVKVRLLLTSAWTTIENMSNQKKSALACMHLSEFNYIFQ